MNLNISIDGDPSRRFFVSRKRTPPKKGEVFFVIDKEDHAAQPIRVRLVEVVMHTKGGEIYRVERV